MRIIASFYKHDDIRFISHLDMQRLFQRAFRRACLPLSYSKGFNPHPLLSFAAALPVGYTSDGEYFDVELEEYLSPEAFTERVNAVLPPGVGITGAFDAGKSGTSLTTLMRSAEYAVKLRFGGAVPFPALKNTAETLLGGEINVMKKTKSGTARVDIRPFVLGIEVVSAETGNAVLNIKGRLTAAGGLPIGLLLNSFLQTIGRSALADINRNKIDMDWASLK